MAKALWAMSLALTMASPVHADSNPCVLLDPASKDVSKLLRGTIPYKNGELTYDSRRQIRDGVSEFVWSITSNTSGYAAEINWGSQNSETEYFGGLVKDGISSPRCKAKSGNEEPDVGNKIFKYRRPFYSWQREEIDTVVRKAEVKKRAPANFMSDISDFLIGTASAQTQDDLTRLHMAAQAGALPRSIAKYYDDKVGLNLRGLVADREALAAYVASGYSPVLAWAFSVTDLPNTQEALDKLRQGTLLSSDDLSPIEFSVVTTLQQRDGEYHIVYIIQSAVLALDDENRNFDPLSFEKINYYPAFVTSNKDLDDIFQRAIKENFTNGTFISALAGKPKAIRVETFAGAAFSTEVEGKLIINSGELSISVLDFPILFPL
jgi:hypothetical protein